MFTHASFQHRNGSVSPPSSSSKTPYCCLPLLFYRKTTLAHQAMILVQIFCDELIPVYDQRCW